MWESAPRILHGPLKPVFREAPETMQGAVGFSSEAGRMLTLESKSRSLLVQKLANTDKKAYFWIHSEELNVNLCLLAQWGFAPRSSRSLCVPVCAHPTVSMWFLGNDILYIQRWHFLTMLQHATFVIHWGNWLFLIDYLCSDTYYVFSRGWMSVYFYHWKVLSDFF